MKTDKLKELIRHIVMESLDALQEEHQKGEWWITDDGGTIFADIDIGDSGHEGVVIQHLTSEILGHFNIHDVEGGMNDYEETIKGVLESDGRFSEEDNEEWESRGPSEVILKKIIEDKLYPTPEQAEDALYIAYGNTSRDARNYGMRYLNWKIMKTYGKYIEIQTWHLKPDDLSAIVRGLWDIIEDDPENEEDPDNQVGEDGFQGPRINLTVAASQKRFHDIPMAVLEKKMAQKLQAYQSGVHVGYTEAINEDYHFHHKEYRLYEGNRHIVVAFDDNTRLKFEVHFRNARGVDKEKWRRKAMSTWKSCANELHRDVPLSDALNPIQKSWKECFKEAMKNPKMKPYIRVHHHHKIFDDKGYPAAVQGKPQAVVDPVNLTPR
jgi:hypothetical protein